jgi:hypothetical protein
MSIQNAYSYGASSDSYLIGSHSYQCVCVLHAILLPSGYLTLSTIAPYTISPNSATKKWFLHILQISYDSHEIAPNPLNYMTYR